MANCSPEKFIRCPVCEDLFPNKQLLSVHITQHLEDKPFVCPACGKIFKTKKTLRGHVANIHKDKSYDELIGNVVPKTTNFEDDCVSVTSDASCASSDVSKSSLKCPKCPKTFRYQSHLKRHEKTHIEKVKPLKEIFRCSYCNKEFQYRSTLERHEIGHRNEKPFVCEICGKAFQRNFKLTIHMRRHNNENPFECLICHKTFFARRHLIQHRVVHTKERIYKCNYCEQSFKQLGTMRKHEKRFHAAEIGYVEEESEAKPHVDKGAVYCVFCPKKYYSNASLNRHARTHTITEVGFPILFQTLYKFHLSES